MAGGLTLRKESLCVECWLKELWKLPPRGFIPLVTRQEGL